MFPTLKNLCCPWFGNSRSVGADTAAQNLPASSDASVSRQSSPTAPVETPSLPPPGQLENASAKGRASLERMMRNTHASTSLAQAEASTSVSEQERHLSERYAPLQSARMKDRGEGVKKVRASEFDHERGVYLIHPERIVLACEGEVDSDTLKAINQAISFLKNEVDNYLSSIGKNSCEDIPREQLIKAINPFKWIVSEDPNIMLGKSKTPEKMGHITLIGGSADPKGRIGGLLYCIKRADGEYRLILDNDSGRFSEGEDRKPHHLKNVANRFNELDLTLNGRKAVVLDDWLDLTAAKS